MLKEINEFMDNNNAININEEFLGKKSDLKIDLVKEIKGQIEKVDYLVINNEWKDFVNGDGVKIISVSTCN